MATLSFEYSKNDFGVTIDKCHGAETVIDVPYIIGGRSVTKIADGAFADCKNVERINLPSGITEFSLDYFAGCENLKEVYWNYTTVKFVGDVVKILKDKEIHLPAFLLGGKKSF